MHGTHITQQQVSFRWPDRSIQQLTRRAELRERSHGKAELPTFDGATGTGHILLLDGVGDVIGGDAEGAQLVGIERHAHFVVWRTRHGNTRHTFDLFETPRVDFGGRTRERAQVYRATSRGIRRVTGAQRGARRECEHRDRPLAWIARK